MSRSQRRARLGLVLGGTGVRGFAQAGAVAALERAGVAPDVVVGVSTGAVVAAAYACRQDWSQALQDLDRKRLPTLAAPDGQQTLARLRSTLRNARQIAPSVWTWGFGGYAEHGRAALAELIGEGVGFEHTRVPCALVATDLEWGERVVLADGSLVAAALAASALPGVARPISHDGRAVIDGVFTDPWPVDVARELGADVVVVAHPRSPLSPAEPDNWMLALLRGFEVGQQAFAEERLSEADLVIRPDLGDTVRSLDFALVDEATRRTAGAVAAEVPRILALLGDR